MGNDRRWFIKAVVTTFISVVIISSCAPKIACPTGHIDAKALAAGAGNEKVLRKNVRKTD